jgi:HK97 family phage major capsid protein
LKDIRLLKDSANHYIWQPFEFPGKQLVGDNPGMIMGRPYVVSEQAPAKTAGAWVAGNYPIVFGDFSHYWIATAMTMEVQALVEKYAEENMVAYIGRMWVDGMPVQELAFTRMKIKA